MSRRSTLTTGAVGAAAIATLVLSAGTAEAHGNPHRLVFEDTTTASTFVDLNNDGVPDPGDSFILHEEATRDGDVIEYNDSQCLVGFDDNFLCHVVVVIKDRGQVIVDGSVAASGGAFPDDFDLAITGGTGDFATARGYAHVHRISDTDAEDSLYLQR